MSWRVVVVQEPCKLDLNLGYMVVRGKELRKVYLDEISVLLIENPGISMTGCLLNALLEKKIKVILCDNSHNPSAELSPIYGSYDCSKKLNLQLSWSKELCGDAWTLVVKEKIGQQARFLQDCGKVNESALLQEYLTNMAYGDETNREGHAAKVYFNGIFGMEFSRSDDNIVNAALNYGYAILLSVFNREIVSSGYLTQLGIWHTSSVNQYNLASDLMEPFRILVDRHVYECKFSKFGTQDKHRMLEFLNRNVYIADSRQTVLNAIRIYSRSVFSALNGQDLSLIRFYSLEEKQ